MPRIAPLDPTAADPATATTLAGVKAKLGVLPNLVRTYAVSPAVLNGWLGLAGGLAGGTLGARLGELIALAVSQANGCAYCVAAHAAIAGGMRVSAAEIAAARAGTAAAPREAAAIRFALAVNRDIGRVDDAEYAALAAAGFTAAEALEIAAHVGLNRLNNTINHVAGTEIDFPAVPALAA